jgi:hypothetical protein
MAVKSKKTPARAARLTGRSTKERATDAAFTTDDAREACAHYEAAALAALGRKIQYNADLNVVPSNVERAVLALRPHLSRADVTADERKAVLELPTMVLALVHAESRCVEASSPRAIADAQSVLRPLRSAMLSYLEAAASEACALLPAERVREVREGKGPIDEARDAVNIAALFKEFARALTGKHPFTAAQLATLEAKGVYLLRALSPADASAVRPAEPSAEVNLRDGLWTLIDEAYDRALLVAAKVWGVRNVNTHVPALLARAASGKSAPVEPPPAS